MISLKIVDENKNVLYKKTLSSEGLKKASHIASSISKALPSILPIIGINDDIKEDDFVILPIMQILLEHGAKGACTFQINRKTWEENIKPIIEGKYD